MDVIKREENVLKSLPVQEVEGQHLRSLSSDLAQRILRILAEGPAYPKEIADKLKTHEQKVYYHIRNLEKAGIIKVDMHENHHGAVAKYYSLSSPAFLLRFKDFEQAGDVLKKGSGGKFLEPFIENNQLNATIVIGDPMAHGPERTRPRDGYYGIDLALFLGTFITYVPMSKVRVDTEIRKEHLRDNLILIGGPAVNKVVEKFNAKMPIRFEKDEHWRIKSDITKKKYEAGEAGLIVKIDNPYAKGKKILVIAGIRYSGTRAATLAFLKNFEEITKGNKKNPKIKAKVVIGIDADSDGDIDEVEFKE
ncbi:MAG: S-layer protein [archaeon]